MNKYLLLLLTFLIFISSLSYSKDNKLKKDNNYEIKSSFTEANEDDGGILFFKNSYLDSIYLDFSFNYVGKDSVAYLKYGNSHLILYDGNEKLDFQHEFEPNFIMLAPSILDSNLYWTDSKYLDQNEEGCGTAQAYAFRYEFNTEKRDSIPIFKMKDFCGFDGPSIYWPPVKKSIYVYFKNLNNKKNIRLNLKFKSNENPK